MVGCVDFVLTGGGGKNPENLADVICNGPFRKNGEKLAPGRRRKALSRSQEIVTNQEGAAVIYGRMDGGPLQIQEPVASCTRPSKFKP